MPRYMYVRVGLVTRPSRAQVRARDPREPEFSSRGYPVATNHSAETDCALIRRRRVKLIDVTDVITTVTEF